MPGIVAIVGRPNVGKSTLFNRLLGQRQAIVHQSSGVTRDRIYGLSDWNGVSFSVVDTGGIVPLSKDLFEKEIEKQARIAIEEADAILFVVDTVTGITDIDTNIARTLREANKNTLLVANKVDHYARIADTYEFYALGLGEPFPISAINGSGTGDLLDALIPMLPELEQETEQERLPRITIVGRPNAGKSSIANAILGQEKNIVTPIPGTTRDAISTPYSLFGLNFLLVDTAGLRKKARVQEDLEYYSVVRAIRAIANADVCILVIDATRGFEAQDQRIYDIIREQKKGALIAVNKWDLIEKENNTADEWVRHIKERVAPANDLPILCTSAITKQRVLKLFQQAIDVYNNCQRRIPTAQLNQALLPDIENFPPPATKGKYIRIKYVTQLPTATPSFAFFCNLPQYVKAPYKRFLENRIRHHFDFQGAPMQIFMRKK